MHAYTSVNVYTNACMRMYASVNAYTYACMHTSVKCAYTYACMHTSVNVHTLMHACILV